MHHMPHSRQQLMIAELSLASLYCKHLSFRQMPRKISERGVATCGKEYSVVTLTNIAFDRCLCGSAECRGFLDSAMPGQTHHRKRPFSAMVGEELRVSLSQLVIRDSSP